MARSVTKSNMHNKGIVINVLHATIGSNRLRMACQLLTNGTYKSNSHWQLLQLTVE